MFEELDYKALISRTFTELYGSSPAILVRAPGRINLIGEHTDYNNGFVFPAAINREIIFAMSPSTRPETSLFALNINKGALVNHKKLVPKSNPAWTNFFSGVVAGLQQRGFDVPAVNCVFGGDIPNGAGLSSSAALEVGFGTALTQLFGLSVEPWDVINIAQKAEHEYVGVKCGIMDMFASKMGKKDHAMLLDCRDLTFDYYPLQLEEHSLLLIDTRVKHSLASSEYNTRRLECELGVTVLKKHKPEANSLRDFNSFEVEELADELPENVFRRCRFVTGEIQRTQAAALDLKKGDLRAFGKKMNDTHRGLSSDYEVSCRELDFLAAEAARFPDEILGARMMGGGFGGCTINIVKKEFEEEFKRHVDLSFTKQFHAAPSFYDISIEAGASVIS
ncbi:MAG: galactokinase [Imperialibacter sp.]|uniref:galactokinase n=1 Tax=Imperialibacter sp. TaxID=2038411 RepID=UPI003A867AD5